jgi:5'-nucleotidase
VGEEDPPLKMRLLCIIISISFLKRFKIKVIRLRSRSYDKITSMKDGRYQILLTNDDGIKSPGIWAAAEALSSLGFVTLAAPRDQASSTGRSLLLTSDGRIHATTLHIGKQDWQVYAVGGTPAQTVLHAVLEIMDTPPDLIVSGINYGENVGDGITISGTVGAAMEGASMGIPSLAMSLQLTDEDFTSYSTTVDFSVAAHFTQIFAKMMLEKKMPPDVDLLKVEIPARATRETPWRVTRLARHRYYLPAIERKGSWDENVHIGYSIDVKPDDIAPDSDIYTLAFDEMVSVTPLSLDMTSRVELKDLEKMLRDSSEQT